MATGSAIMTLPAIAASWLRQTAATTLTRRSSSAWRVARTSPSRLASVCAVIAGCLVATVMPSRKMTTKPRP